MCREPEEPSTEEMGQKYHQELKNEGEERISVSIDNEEREEGSNEENSVRLRSPIKRNLGSHHETIGIPLGVVSRSAKGIKPLRFREIW